MQMSPGLVPYRLIAFVSALIPKRLLERPGVVPVPRGKVSLWCLSECKFFPVTKARTYSCVNDE